jgi:dethiobiotin synthetase
MAAAAEGRSIDENLLIQGATLWHDRCTSLVVEGAGGWQSPISTQLTNADIAQRLGYPVILIAANKLGVVNHVLLTLESIRHAGLTTKLILLNDRLNQPDGSVQSNLELLTSFVTMRFGAIAIGKVDYRGEIPEALIELLLPK